MNQTTMIYLGHCNSFVIGEKTQNFNHNQKCELCFSMLNGLSLPSVHFVVVVSFAFDPEKLRAEISIDSLIFPTESFS